MRSLVLVVESLARTAAGASCLQDKYASMRNYLSDAAWPQHFRQPPTDSPHGAGGVGKRR